MDLQMVFPPRVTAPWQVGKWAKGEWPAVRGWHMFDWRGWVLAAINVIAVEIAWSRWKTLTGGDG